MKKFILFAFVAFPVIICSGLVTSKFTTWQSLIDNSSEIVVVRCITPKVSKSEISTTFKSQIEVVDVLKGKEDEKLNRLLISEYLPHQGDYYLVFAQQKMNGMYYASADYRVVSMGAFYRVDMAVGKTIEEKVRSLLKDRLYIVNRELERDQEEKLRLEQAFK